LTDNSETFLARRDKRRQSRELTQLLVLGWAVSSICFVSGTYHYLAVIGASDRVWFVVAWAGLLGGLLTLTVPVIWQWPERALRGVGQIVGRTLMFAILGLVYFVFVWPVGLIIQRRTGTRPIYYWNQKAPADAEGWIPKSMPPGMPGVAGRKRATQKSAPLSIIQIFTFFVRRGNLLLIPSLLILISVGITLFFLQTSALAPLIYTLF
jgi:hypothetical protein